MSFGCPNALFGTSYTQSHFILKLETAISRANRLERAASLEQTRADEAQATVREMLAVPEIKQKWKEVKYFNQQMKSWITDAVKAISDFAKDSSKVLFSDEDEKIIGTGIIAEAHLCGLDPTNEHQRKQAANSLIGKVDWQGTTPFAGEVAQARTRQLSDEMSITKEIMENVLLSVGGRGLTGGGSSASNDWGKKPDDDREWARECLRRAHDLHLRSRGRGRGRH